MTKCEHGHDRCGLCHDKSGALWQDAQRPVERLVITESEEITVTKTVFAALDNTFKAKWWELWLASIFGKTTVTSCAGWSITVRHWRGKYYMTNCRRTNNDRI